ncbi:MAG: cardiolipin synthase [Eubacterium sp.]|nr:cardiolipin synthase [Eubacterium sp.]
MAFTAISFMLSVVVVVLILTGLSLDHIAIVILISWITSIVLSLIIYAQNKTSSMKMPWIILMLAIPFVGLIVYLLIGLNGGTRKMKKRYREIDERLIPVLTRKGDEAVVASLRNMDSQAVGISEYIRRSSGYPLWNNTDVEYFDSANRSLERQLEDFENARDFIFMEYHAIEDKISWAAIEKVLVKKVNEGVEVRVFYDDMGSISFITMDFVGRMEELGIQCRAFNPLAPGLNMFLNNRDHRKLTVIDGRIGYTGSYNLADKYFGITHPYGEWRDCGIRLQGDAVKSLTVTFLEMWNAAKPRKKYSFDTDLEKYLPDHPYESKGDTFIQPYGDSPMDRERVGENVYISMIEKAERYCYFVSPYLILTDEMTHAISLAAKRGVDVRILTPGIPDKKIVYGVTRSFYHPLVINGVRIFEWTPGFCHCKLCVVDDRMSVCGTINLDYRSLYHHFENACWIYDADIAVRIREDIESLLAQSREVTFKYGGDRNPGLRLGQLFLRLFAELL